MSHVIRVGLDISERSLRYAIVRRTGDGDRLLKLGRVDFSFDLASALGGEPGSLPTGKPGSKPAGKPAGKPGSKPGSDRREAVSGALTAVVSEYRPNHLRAALHAPLCRSFFSQCSVGHDSSTSARFEAELLGYCAEGDESAVTADVVWSDGETDRLHVSVIEGVVLDRLGSMVDRLGCDEAQAVSAQRAAAEVVRRLPRAADLGSSRVLAVGRFDTLEELLVLDEHGWRFSADLFASAVPDPRRVLCALDAAGESTVDAVLSYGDPVQDGGRSDYRGARTMRMDPLALVSHDPGSLKPDERPGRYTAAIGAALLR